MAALVADRVRAAAWPVLAATALLAACLWLTAIQVEYLVPCGIATAAAVGALRSVPRAKRAWASLSTGALLVLAGLAIGTQWRLHRIDSEWPEEHAALVSAGLTTLSREVDRAIGDLQSAADRALEVSADSNAFARLNSRFPRDRDEGVVVDSLGVRLAWAGMVRVPTESLYDAVGVARTSFYVSLYAVARKGARRAVAVRLLDAGSPANRVSDPLAAEVARRIGVPGFTFSPASNPPPGADALPLRSGTRILLFARLATVEQDAVREDMLERTRLAVAFMVVVALTCFIIATWRLGRLFRWRLAAVAVGLACTAVAPLHGFSNYSRLFDPALYRSDIGGPLTANAGALGITSALTLLALLAGVRRLSRGAPRLIWLAVVLAIAGLGPFLVRDLARGIQVPAYGVNASLWLIWEIPIFLAATCVLLAGATAGSAALGVRWGVAPWVGPLVAGVAAALAPVAWLAPDRWPWWYPIPWIVAIAALTTSKRSRAIVSSGATVAALGATALVWGQTTRGRVALAERDVRGLSVTDAFTTGLVGRFGDAVRSVEGPVGGRAWLLRAYANSEIAAAGLPAWMSVWENDSVPSATLVTADFAVPIAQVSAVVRDARRENQTRELPLLAEPAVELAVAVPTAGAVVVAVTAPPTRLIVDDPYVKLLGIEQSPDAEPPYALQLGESVYPAPPGTPVVVWRREASALHGDWVARTGAGASRLHVEIELRSIPALVERGALVVLTDLGIVGLLWLGSVLADGAVGRWLRERQRRWRRSYRTRLTLALFGFFMIPAFAFAIWSYQELATDAAQSRQLLLFETLRAVAPSPGTADWLPNESRRLETPLFLYAGGSLAGASDALLADLAPTGRMLPPNIHSALALHHEVAAGETEQLGTGRALFGFRTIDTGRGTGVIAAPAHADDLALDRRRRDLGVLVMFATAVGALAAFWLSGIAARQLARPIGSLRQAALTLAAGGRTPMLESNTTVEFRPVVAAFTRMANDLEASRSARAHAERVLAWGEMARQVAHEIKNPLTPIRLGVQHLLRARADKRVDFDRVLDENAQRILAEIDHLDEIARAFSRYGSSPGDRAPAEPTDVVEVVRDLTALERMGEGQIQWLIDGGDARTLAMAQRGELREVLLNLYENSRLAGARCVRTTITRGERITIDVHDDGAGIPADVLPRIFEPHFSTRTSGSGLGLALSRRLIDGWDGMISVKSALGVGTTVRISLRAAG
jgi:two-component system, NtrC family, nitrogen regulation sensor histidine kinase NtrY